MLKIGEDEKEEAFSWMGGPTIIIQIYLTKLIQNNFGYIWFEIILVIFDSK